LLPSEEEHLTSHREWKFPEVAKRELSQKMNRRRKRGKRLGFSHFI
jgi:hypothetical protein